MLSTAAAMAIASASPAGGAKMNLADLTQGEQAWQASVERDAELSDSAGDARHFRLQEVGRVVYPPGVWWAVVEESPE